MAGVDHDPGRTFFWNRIARFYNPVIGFAFGKTYLRLRDELCSDLDRRDEVLEIGTGSGVLALAMASHVNAVTAIDLAPKMVAVAHRRARQLALQNLRLAVGDACRLPVVDQGFDAVVASNILHLLPEPARCLAEIRRVLRPGGRAILPTFCHGENRQSRRWSAFARRLGLPERQGWTVDAYLDLLRNSGWQINRQLTIPGRMPLAYAVVC